MIMGSTLRGIQCYGFDLGGVEGEWFLKGVQGYNSWEPSWVTADELAASDFSYLSAIEDRLKASELDLQVVTYGMTQNDYTGYVLAAWSVKCQGSKTLAVYPEDVEARRHIERWDEALLKGLEALEIRPWQPNPAFLLTQSYG